ncbi:MAG: tetratricopeptide repeat protein [Acutalibacteraceae bacterium]|nr:tetratricopeptide repeat protein [Acutalibacteraceae bacterium]
MTQIPTQRIIEKLDEFLSKNDYESAREHLLYWLKESENMGDNRAALLICNELMGLCRKLGEAENALMFVERALNKIKQMNIENNVGAATTYLNSATVFKAFGKADEAIPLFEKAKSIYEANLSQDDARLGGLYNNMALALVDLERFEDALSLYEKAISVMTTLKNKEPEQAITYLNMASAAEAQYGLEDGAEKIAEYTEKAQALLDIGKERLDGEYAFACEKCATVFGYYGYFYYENELKERSRRIYEGA